MKGKVTVVLDSQAGSCGKGKLVGYLALRDNPTVAINNFMTNAGHTFVYDDGTKVITQHLPTSMVNPSVILCIGPGSAITPSVLIDEILKYRDILGGRKVYIHPRAMIIRPHHVEIERQTIRSGSTFKGCGAAQAQKIMRVPDSVVLMKDYEPYFIEVMRGMNTSIEDAEYVMDTINVMDTMVMVNNVIDSGKDVIVEGSQGCDLDINYGLEYPHCTSRQCHAGQLLADCGIAPSLVTDVIMIMRPYPIRISNETNIGIDISSGSYLDSPEITWDEIKKRCGAPDDVELGEFTTVTKKLRRVFELNMDRLKYVTRLNRPTQIALNFAQYIDWSVVGAKKVSELTDKVADFVNKIVHETGVPVTFIGTGAKNSDIVDWSTEEE